MPSAGAAAPQMVAYDEAPLRPLHRRLAVAGTAGVFADGYGLGIIGIALSLASAQLQLGPLWIGLIGGASLAGLFAGALFIGPVCDRFGRRPIFACNMALAGILSLLQFLVVSGAQLLAIRLLVGFLLGTDYVVSKTLLTEFSPRRLRGRVLAVLSIAWAGGYACAYAVGFALTAHGPSAWRWMLLTSAAPCLLIAPLRMTIPESPLWLVNHGEPERAARIVRERLGDFIHAPVVQPRAPAGRGRWRQLLSGRWRVRTLVGCTFFTCQVIPYFAVGTFIAQVMAALQLEGAYVGGLFYNAALLLGAVAGLLLIDRMPRRVFLLGTFSAAAATMLVLSTWNHMPPALMVALFALFACVLSAASNLVYVYLPELFPTDLRASGIGLAIAASRIGSAISTFLLPIVVARVGAHAALGACFAVLTLGALVCQRWAPETAGTPLASLDT
jgi:MFS transporter, putative metabolite transport protein